MLTLRELQLLTESVYSVQDSRKDLNRAVAWFMAQPDQENAINVAFIEERQLPKEIAIQHKIFFVDESLVLADIPEEFHEQSLGLIRWNKLVFSGRLVYPVMDVKGDVMGFCGWDKFEKPKYLDSTNHGYKAKQSIVYGMEKLEEYYNSSEPVYVVEGIVCCLYLRSLGLQALAVLGSSLSPYVIQILKRFGKRLIVIPDNDAFGKDPDEIGESLSGENFVRQARRVLPQAKVIQSVIAKDVDDSRKIEDKQQKFVEELIAIARNPFVFTETIRVR